jgi:hypothetical protein
VTAAAALDAYIDTLPTTMHPADRLLAAIRWVARQEELAAAAPILCRHLGHQWATIPDGGTFRTCTHCHEPGWQL